MSILLAPLAPFAPSLLPTLRFTKSNQCHKSMYDLLTNMAS